MINNTENLLLNESQEVKSDFLLVKSKLNEFGIALANSNVDVVFSNHIISVVKRMQSGEDLIQYYFEDDRQISNLSRHALVISEAVLSPLFEKYNVNSSYSEVILCAMHIQLILDQEF